MKRWLKSAPCHVELAFVKNYQSTGMELGYISNFDPGAD